MSAAMVALRARSAVLRQRLDEQTHMHERTAKVSATVVSAAAPAITSPADQREAPEHSL